MEMDMINTFLIVSITLGSIIILSGCFKVLIKNQNIEKPVVTWLIIGVVLVVLPIAGNITIQYGDFKVFINNTSEQVKELEENLKDLKIENSELLGRIAELDNQILEYQEAMTDPSIPNSERDEILLVITSNLESINTKATSFNTKLNSSISKSDTLIKNFNQFESKKWYKK